MSSFNIAFFSATKTDQHHFCPPHLPDEITLHFFENHLTPKTKNLAQGYEAVCVFVNDQVNNEVMEALHQSGVRLILLRCAGFNNVDIKKAFDLGITVLRVPSYSPMAVAEHAVALMLTLNRKTHKAYNRVREGNFSLEGLMGFDLFSKTAGIIGTGRIGRQLIPILKGFGMEVLAYDPNPSTEAEKLGARYVSLETLYQQSQIISLHLPLLPETQHMINARAIAQMPQGVMLINTSRGGLLDTPAVINALKKRHIGYLGIDVYEQEENLFFEDHSEEIIEDDVFERLTTFPNVLITAHQAFFTQEAMAHIRETTRQNALDFKHQHINPINCVQCEP
ncbi:D-lactate dehydrogenase [hydrothermal vent metagenome]|uniref:D-lactate dehydrogenase n=1 Tax=hydrothermal vent metagenome TaxID=652676 RepID=A0A3B0VZ89_9ZZZZ